MDAILRHKLLAFLAETATEVSSGAADHPASELAEIPEPMMDELLVEVEDESWQTQDLLRLAGLLSEDPREQIRRRTAELLATTHRELPGGELEAILATLAQDEEPLVRTTLAPAVAEWLGLLSELRRACVVLEWSLSNEPLVRQTLAEALCYELTCLGDDLVIEHLVDDESPQVRVAAARAARRRLDQNPELYTALLRRLSRDEDRLVRRVAHRASVCFERLN